MKTHIKILTVLISAVLISFVAGGVYVSSLGSQPQASVENNAIVSQDVSPTPISHGSTSTASPIYSPSPILPPSPTPRPWHDFNVYYDIATNNGSSIVIDLSLNGFCFTSPITSDLSIDSFSLCINNTVYSTHAYSNMPSLSTVDLSSFNGTKHSFDDLQATFTFKTDISGSSFRSNSVPVLTYNGPYSVWVIPAI
jgi:hypothetical protein